MYPPTIGFLLRHRVTDRVNAASKIDRERCEPRDVKVNKPFCLWNAGAEEAIHIANGLTFARRHRPRVGLVAGPVLVRIR